MHGNQPNWFANFKIMIFVLYCHVASVSITLFSSVRHVSQLGKTHVSPFSIPDSNTDFAFATGRTLQPVHLACIPSRISLFCIDPDDFQASVWNKWQICCWWFKSTSCLAPSQFCLGPICLTSPSTFLN